jgi:serine/threonine protein kinase
MEEEDDAQMQDYVDLKSIEWSKMNYYNTNEKKVIQYFNENLQKCYDTQIMCKKTKHNIVVDPKLVARLQLMKNLAEGVFGKTLLFKADDKVFVGKVPKSEEGSVIYEFLVGLCMNTLRHSMNNFVFTFGIFNNSDQEDVLLIESVKPGKTFAKLIAEMENMTEIFFLSHFVQILIALQIAQDSVDFTHYDLHSENVLIEEIDCCDVEKGEEVVYVFEYGNIKYGLPTTYNMKIIDFGNSYVKRDCVNNSNFLKIKGFTHKYIAVHNFEKFYAYLFDQQYYGTQQFEFKNNKPNFKIDMDNILLTCLLNLKEKNSPFFIKWRNFAVENKFVQRPIELANYIYKNFIFGKFNSEGKKIFLWNSKNQRSRVF